MSDIVERLNEIKLHWCVASVETKTVYEVGQICADAKVEIELLRKELKSLVDWEEPLHRILRLSDGDFSYLEADFAKARAALGEGKE